MRLARPVGGNAREEEDLVTANRFHSFNVDPEVRTRILHVGKEPLDAIPAFVHPATRRTGVHNSMSSVQQAR
jgi:hypothetical protein